MTNIGQQQHCWPWLSPSAVWTVLLPVSEGWLVALANLLQPWCREAIPTVGNYLHTCSDSSSSYIRLIYCMVNLLSRLA